MNQTQVPGLTAVSGSRRPRLSQHKPGRMLAYVCLLTVLIPLERSAARGQELDKAAASPVAPPAETLSVSSLQAKRKELENNTTLDEAARKSAIEALSGAITALQQEQSFLESAQKLQSSGENVSEQLELTRAELEAPTEESETPSKTDDLATIQQRLQRFEDQLRAAETEKTELDRQDALRTQRRTESPAELIQVKASLAALEASADDPNAADEPVEVQEANVALKKAKRRALEARQAFLDREIPNYDTTAALLAAKRSLAARRVAEARRTVAKWQDYVSQQRTSEAETNLQQARELAAAATEPAQLTAEALLQLAEDLVQVRKKLSEDITATNATIAQVEDQTKRLKAEFEEITERAKVAGLTNSVGVLLRKQNSMLPDERRLERDTAERQATISATHIQRIEYQNQRSAVADVEDLAERLSNEQGQGLSDDNRRLLRNELRILLQARGRYLDGVIADLGSYLDRLAALDARQRLLLQQTQQQSVYIAEQILWVQSTTAIDTNIGLQLAESFGQLRQDAGDTGDQLLADMMEQPQLWLTALVAAGLLLAWRKRLREGIRGAGEEALKSITVRMQPTVTALSLTVLVSAIWPAVFWFLGLAAA